MTDAAFQPSLTNTQTAKTATSTHKAISVFHVLRSKLFAKRQVNADTLLAAQARREVARRNVDNLLR